MRQHNQFIVFRLPLILVLSFLSGCCGMIAGEAQPRPTLPPIQGPQIVTATPRAMQAAPAAAANATAATTAVNQLPAAGASKMVVSADGDGLYVRSKPEMNARVSVWPDGTVVEVFSCDEAWCRVQTPNGYQGYMPRQYLVPAPGSAPLPAATAAPAQTKVAAP